MGEGAEWQAAKQPLSGGWVCLEGVRGHHDIPKQASRQLDGNQLTSCYEKVLLCFYLQTIDGGRAGGPLIHRVASAGRVKVSATKLVSDQCRPIDWPSTFQDFYLHSCSTKRMME